MVVLRGFRGVRLSRVNSEILETRGCFAKRFGLFGSDSVRLSRNIRRSIDIWDSRDPALQVVDGNKSKDTM